MPLWMVPVAIVVPAFGAFAYMVRSTRHDHDFVLEEPENFIKCGCGEHVFFSRV